jgi:hypothetical protein
MMAKKNEPIILVDDDSEDQELAPLTLKKALVKKRGYFFLQRLLPKMISSS